MTTLEPVVMLPVDVNCAAPASAAKIMWPLGKAAAGASSAPKAAGEASGIGRVAQGFR